MGNKLSNCRDAVDSIKKTKAGRIIAHSKFYYTEPVDFVDQDWFLNAVLKIETTLEPITLIRFAENSSDRRPEKQRNSIWTTDYRS